MEKISVDTVTVTINGKNIDYKVINNTAYHIDTPMEVIRILESYRDRNERLHLCYGDSETGRDWNEIYDIDGYIGRSTGRIKVPLLVHNSRSMGGSAILDHCIVKIQTARGKVTLYEHPTYYKKEE